MSWIAVLLIGVAVADLAHSVRPVPVVNECAGAAVAVFVGLLAGLTDIADVLALAVIAVLVVLWGQTVTRGFGRSPLPAWVPLLVLGGALALGVLVSPLAGSAGGVLGDWLDAVTVPTLRGLPADRALLLCGVFLAMLSTGNVLVRLVLTVTHTTDPVRYPPTAEDEPPLKGGRLLGPMERVLIVGLGLAGHLTAASIVIAAKGLLRWPELQAKPEREDGGVDSRMWNVHRVTEYFLVGSFVSWLVALGGLVVLAR
jgi:hypothetical protein